MRPPLAVLLTLCAAAGLVLPGGAAAQFRDDFAGPSGSVPAGWSFFTGDGQATMTFTQARGLARMRVDATRDMYNVWWALIKRNVAPDLDLSRVGGGRELRVTARVRARVAPRRVNLHFNTQRTTDFHTHLMEYDLPDTLWHTISMTTHGFEAHPGDTVNAQLALMDWGIGRWGVDLDWYRVDVVDPDSVGPDLGEPLPYRPPVPDVASFAQRVDAAQCGTIEPGEDLWLGPFVLMPDTVGGKSERVVVADGARVAILRWDLRAYAGRRATRAGVLELAARSVQWALVPSAEMAKVRVSEILGGDPAWKRESVSARGLARGRPLDQIFNGQMIQDVEVAEPPALTRVVIPRPVLQRLLDGRTKGLVLRAQPGVDAAFGENAPPPRLYFDVARP